MVVVVVVVDCFRYQDWLCGGAAVLAVNIVIGLYALQAYQENVAEKEMLEARERAAEVRWYYTYIAIPGVLYNSLHLLGVVLGVHALC